MDEYNSITGLPIKKADDSKERNVITGMIQDVKDDGNVRKSDEAKWPSISDIDKRDEEQEHELQPAVKKSTDERPWPSLICQLDDNEDDNISEVSKSISMNVPVFAIEKKGDEHIVMGIVYEPDTVDAQGDQASEEEIRKAAYHFMENNPTFKIQHKGKPVNIKVLESYIAPQDFTIAKRNVKKGSWVLVTRILNKQLWKDIKAGKMTGFSMAGYAKVE